MDGNNYNFEQKIRGGGYKRVVAVAENIRLRPNDTLVLLGTDKFRALKSAVEKVLETDYKDDEIYQYYYTVDRQKHGFCTFERWKKNQCEHRHRVVV